MANTAIDWQGDRWAMVMLPLPEDAYTRRVLLAHESFHRIQPKLGLTSKEVANAHLDTVEGRYLMQLEWRALAAALGGVRDFSECRRRRRRARKKRGISGVHRNRLRGAVAAETHSTSDRRVATSGEDSDLFEIVRLRHRSGMGSAARDG
jgi:hypothetical protein